MKPPPYRNQTHTGVSTPARIEAGPQGTYGASMGVSKIAVPCSSVFYLARGHPMSNQPALLVMRWGSGGDRWLVTAVQRSPFEIFWPILSKCHSALSPERSAMVFLSTVLGKTKRYKESRPLQSSGRCSSRYHVIPDSLHSSHQF